MVASFLDTGSLSQDVVNNLLTGCRTQFAPLVILKATDKPVRNPNIVVEL